MEELKSYVLDKSNKFIRTKKGDRSELRIEILALIQSLRLSNRDNEIYRTSKCVELCRHIIGKLEKELKNKLQAQTESLGVADLSGRKNGNAALFLDLEQRPLFCTAIDDLVDHLKNMPFKDVKNVWCRRHENAYADVAAGQQRSEGVKMSYKKAKSQQ